MTSIRAGGGGGGDITAITFKADWDDDINVSVIIEDNLSSNLSMELVMVDGGVFNDLSIPVHTLNLYKVIFSKTNGKKLTLKWGSLRM